MVLPKLCRQHPAHGYEIVSGTLHTISKFDETSKLVTTEVANQGECSVKARFQLY